eukprot:IDg22004t1
MKIPRGTPRALSPSLATSHHQHQGRGRRTKKIRDCAMVRVPLFPKAACTLARCFCVKSFFPPGSGMSSIFTGLAAELPAGRKKWEW